MSHSDITIQDTGRDDHIVVNPLGSLSDKLTITVTQNPGIEPGDEITTKAPDYRWWMRLWRFITFRSPPIIETRSVVLSVDLSTVTIQSSNMDA